MMIALACLAVAAIGIERVWLALAQPLWFDETWTVAVAAAPDGRALLHEIYNDANAPLYYVLAWAWRLIAGPSDIALRTPGLIAVFVAGAIPLLARLKGLSLEARLAWGAMIFGWWGVDIFLNGRCYSLLMAVSVLQCVAFARLLRSPTTGRAWVWCAVGACAVLIQYYAIVGVATQGLIYLAARRGQAVRTWPALLAFVPMFAWMAYHAPRLRAFSDTAVAWHPLVDPARAASFATFTLNPSSPLVPVAVVLALAAILLVSRRDAAAGRDEPEEPVPELWLTALAALLAFALILLSGVLRPTLTNRYFVPVAPGVLLGLVLFARHQARAHLAYLALMAIYLAAPLRPDNFADGLRSRSQYGYEQASATLMAHKVTSVIYVWDHELAPIMDPGSLQRVGAVFFRRAGDMTPVTALAPRPTDDVNRLILAQASGPRPGVIWLYNRDGRTSARAHPPRLPQIDPRWTCERIGDDRVGNLACYRTP
ncbi:MAG TPA: hypothetical protein VFW47_04575 [Phenylobacterium sp.]|nr:hypothetical protein [Phenylobacterium sp.]